MGSTEDPKDGGRVAGAVFGAVGVYAVCILHEVEEATRILITTAVLPVVLRLPGLYAPTTEPWRNSTDIKTDIWKRRKNVEKA